MAELDGSEKPKIIPGRDAPFWRQDEPEIDPETGLVITGGMFSHQSTWWGLPNFCKILVGGYGSGKTISLCKRAIGTALDNAPCPVAIVSPSFPVAKRTVIPTLRELLEGKRQLLGGFGFRWEENKTDHIFRARYLGRSAEIQVYSGENPDSLKGPNLAAAYIDEPFVQSIAVFHQMLARVRHPRALRWEIGLTGTPESLNWGWELCEGELRSKHDVGFVRASSRANVALPPDFVSRLVDAYDEKAVEAYVEGHFVNLAGGLVYHTFSRFDSVVEVPRPESAELGCGMDFNVSPMAFTVFWRDGDHLHFVEEFELPNSDTEDACAVLRSKYPELRDVYPDASGRSRATNAPGGVSDFDHIRAAGFRVNAHEANGPRRDRYNAVNGRLKVRPDGTVNLTISPRCRRLIRYLSSYSHAHLNRPDHKEMSHLLDAFSYAVAYLFPLGRPQVRKVQLVGH